jgi:DNA-binding IclR family transcriptional regulator
MSESEKLEDRAAVVKRTPKPRVGAIERALQILDQLQAAGTPLTAYEIARASGAPGSTIYSIVDEMVESGLLEKAGDGPVWLGPRLFAYGLSYAQRLDYLSAAVEEMQNLCKQVQETVQICGRDDGMMVVLQTMEGPGHFHVTSRVGTRVPMNWTASGRLLVGHLSARERESYYARYAQPSPTGKAECDPRKLSDLAARAIADRISVQAGEADASVACIAAPVLNAVGECIITISIVVPENKAVEKMDYFIKAVQDAASCIEKKMQWLSR